MHEYGIARDIVRQAVAEAQRCGALRVVSLDIGVGPASAIDGDALVLGIQAAARGTLAEGVAVDITRAGGGGIVLESLEVEEETRCV